MKSKTNSVEGDLITASATQMLEEYLRHSLPTRWMLLWAETVEGLATNPLTDLIFDDTRMLDLTRPGVREKVTEAVLASPDLRELLLEEARDFWHFRQSLACTPIESRTIRVFLLEGLYEKVRRLNLPIGVGVNKTSPDSRYRACVTEYINQPRLLPRSYHYNFEVEDRVTGNCVAFHHAKRLRRPWKTTFHLELTIAWSSDSRHVQFRVGKRLTWVYSLEDSENTREMCWENNPAGIEPHLEFPRCP